MNKVKLRLCRESQGEDQQGGGGGVKVPVAGHGVQRGATQGGTPGGWGGAVSGQGCIVPTPIWRQWWG